MTFPEVLGNTDKNVRPKALKAMGLTFAVIAERIEQPRTKTEREDAISGPRILALEP